jgi:hypothetical protein
MVEDFSSGGEDIMCDPKSCFFYLKHYLKKAAFTLIFSPYRLHHKFPFKNFYLTYNIRLYNHVAIAGIKLQ